MPILRRSFVERNAAQHQTESLDYHLINDKALQWHHHSSRHVQRRVLGYDLSIEECAVHIIPGRIQERYRQVLVSGPLAHARGSQCALGGLSISST